MLFQTRKIFVHLRKIWTKPFNSYGLVLGSLYELFEASKCQLRSSLWRDKALTFHQQD